MRKCGRNLAGQSLGGGWSGEKRKLIGLRFHTGEGCFKKLGKSGTWSRVYGLEFRVYFSKGVVKLREIGGKI